MGFILGASVGVAVGYFLNSDKKDEVVDLLKDKVDALKAKVNEMKDDVKRKVRHTRDDMEEAIAG
jgi:hypothetical protein